MAQPVIVTYSGAGAKPWRNLDYRATPFNAAFNMTVTGTISYSLELTNSDVNGTVEGDPNTAVTPLVAPSTVTAASTSQFYNLTQPQRFWRINIASGTGSVTVEAIQAGY